jgi:hypothetical protein
MTWFFTNPVWSALQWGPFTIHKQDMDLDVADIEEIYYELRVYVLSLWVISLIIKSRLTDMFVHWCHQ